MQFCQPVARKARPDMQSINILWHNEVNDTLLNKQVGKHVDKFWQLLLMVVADLDKQKFFRSSKQD